MTDLRTAARQSLEVWDMGILGYDLDRAMEDLRASLEQIIESKIKGDNCTADLNSMTLPKHE